MHSCLSISGAGVGRQKADAFNPQTDYARFESGNWPQSYLTICDISSARAVLAERVSVPVYAVGGSNGGRYAAVAAGVDPKLPGTWGFQPRTGESGTRFLIRAGREIS